MPNSVQSAYEVFPPANVGFHVNKTCPKNTTKNQQTYKFFSEQIYKFINL